MQYQKLMDSNHLIEQITTYDKNVKEMDQSYKSNDDMVL